MLQEMPVMSSGGGGIPASATLITKAYNGTEQKTFTDAVDYCIGFSSNVSGALTLECVIIERGQTVPTGQSNDTISLSADGTTVTFVRDSGMIMYAIGVRYS